MPATRSNATASTSGKQPALAITSRRARRQARTAVPRKMGAKEFAVKNLEYEWSQTLRRKVEKEENKRLGTLLAKYNAAEFEESVAVERLEHQKDALREKLDWYRVEMENERKEFGRRMEELRNEREMARNEKARVFKAMEDFGIQGVMRLPSPQETRFKLDFDTEEWGLEHRRLRQDTPHPKAGITLFEQGSSTAPLRTNTPPPLQLPSPAIRPFDYYVNGLPDYEDV